MSDYNKKLIDRIDKMKQVLSKKSLSKIAGEMLVENIREQADQKFKKGNSKWQYEYHNSFHDDNVVFYDESKKQVRVHHPAAKRLEYGLGKDLVITPKKAKALSYIGDDGQRWFSTKEVIPAESCPPIGYAYLAIKKTKKEFNNRIKEELGD